MGRNSPRIRHYPVRGIDCSEGSSNTLLFGVSKKEEEEEEEGVAAVGVI